MTRKYFTLCIFLIVCVSSLHAGRTLSRTSQYAGRRTYGQAFPPQETITQPPPQTPKEYLDSKSGFSTFGIISIIFAVIVFCLAFYYSIICYPLLCRDDKKYKFMDVSSTITSTRGRSIDSIEQC